MDDQRRPLSPVRAAYHLIFSPLLARPAAASSAALPSLCFFQHVDSVSRARHRGRAGLLPEASAAGSTALCNSKSRRKHAFRCSTCLFLLSRSYAMSRFDTPSTKVAMSSDPEGSEHHQVFFPSPGSHFSLFVVSVLKGIGYSLLTCGTLILMEFTRLSSGRIEHVDPGS